MDRKDLGQRADEYLLGYEHGLHVASAEREAREEEAFELGKRRGLERGHRYAWLKLFWVVMVASLAGHFVWALAGTLVGS